MQFSITLSLVIITVLVSLGGFSNHKVIDDLIFYPPAITRKNQWYRFFTSGLIHADAMHLIFNMVTLLSFGPVVENQFSNIFGDSGKWYYLAMYISALPVASLPTYFKHKNDTNYYSLGASGAISTVLFAGLMIAPQTEVRIILIPIPIPGFVFAPLYLLISAYFERRGDTNINHSAHIWGAVYGFVFVIVAGWLAGYNALQGFVDGVQLYLRTKGWLR